MDWRGASAPLRARGFPPGRRCAISARGSARGRRRSRRRRARSRGRGGLRLRGGAAGRMAAATPAGGLSGPLRGGGRSSGCGGSRARDVRLGSTLRWPAWSVWAEATGGRQRLALSGRRARRRRRWRRGARWRRLMRDHSASGASTWRVTSSGDGAALGRRAPGPEGEAARRPARRSCRRADGRRRPWAERPAGARTTAAAGGACPAWSDCRWRGRASRRSKGALELWAGDARPAAGRSTRWGPEASSDGHPDRQRDGVPCRRRFALRRQPQAVRRTGSLDAASKRAWTARLASSISRSATRSIVRRAPPAVLPGAGLASVTRQWPRIATERSRSSTAKRPSVPTASSPEAGRTRAPSNAKRANFSTKSSSDTHRVAT